MSDPAQQLVSVYQDPGVIEMMINPTGDVYAERAGVPIEKMPFQVTPEDAAGFISFISGGEQEVGAMKPCADITATDGSRVHVVAPPIAPGGYCVTIRKRPKRRLSLEEMVGNGSITPVCAGFLRYCVQLKKNFLIVGGTSSGKTSLLNALVAQADPKDRVVVLEDTQEVALPQPHVVYLKTRIGAAGYPDVTLRDLVVNALRMRPDRVVVGEVRSIEAVELLQAMNVGQDGTMATIHANSAREALGRMETLVLFSGLALPLPVLRTYLSQALDLIVFCARLSDGTRRVCQVAEITGVQADMVTMADIFMISQSRNGDAGATYELKPTGAIPRFYDALRQQGINPPTEIFKP